MTETIDVNISFLFKLNMLAETREASDVDDVMLNGKLHNWSTPFIRERVKLYKNWLVPILISSGELRCSHRHLNNLAPKHLFAMMERAELYNNYYNLLPILEKYRSYVTAARGNLTDPGAFASH